MRYALLPEHHHYFDEHGSLSLEELVEPFALQGEVGRDLWREDAELARWVKSKKLSEIAASLTGVRPLRLLYDQLVMSWGDLSLEEGSAFQGVVGGWLLQPSGDGEFFAPSTPLVLTEGPTLLIVYGKGSAVYTSNPRDPYRFLLKDQGYNYGDRLKDSSHPTVLT